MSTGSVNVVQVNNYQGDFTRAERAFLFIGDAAEEGNNKKLLAITPQSDLDTLLGSADSELKTMIEAAIANAQSDEFVCYAMPIIPGTDDWAAELDRSLSENPGLVIEGVVICTPAADQAAVIAAQTAMDTMLSKYAIYLTCHYAVRGIDPTPGTGESWADYRAAIKALNNSVAAKRVALVPLLFGNDLGAVIGRLCNPAVSIADSPMRVATGAVTGLGTTPTDKDGVALSMADIKDLSDARFSVPQWYTGYNGIYWADHMMLDNDGGDFQVFENLRVMDYLARRVRVLAIARIADRRLNSTSKSIEMNKSYFMRPLREAAQSVLIGTVELPGMIQRPEEGDITITWPSSTEAAIAIAAKPYNNPKKITVYLGLDLNKGA